MHEELLKEYPLPWSIENLCPDYDGAGGYIIRSANGETVIHGGTYSGDGDMECNLTYLQAKDLVDIANASKRR